VTGVTGAPGFINTRISPTRLYYLSLAERR
jgi:hypothetical protein